MMQEESNPEHLEFLMLEDQADDAELIQIVLKKNFPGCGITHVDIRESFSEALSDAETKFDIILSDWSLPGFDGLAALDMVQKRNLEMPFILVSGKIGEEAAIEAIHHGSYDYVLKDNLSRLPTAIRHALELYERRKKEKEDADVIQLQATALNASTSAAAIVNRTGMVEWINPAFSDLSGYASNEMVGEDIHDFMYGVCPFSFESILESDAIKKEYQCITVEKKKNGDLYFEDRRICPVLDSSNMVHHFVILKRDITQAEQKKRELELELLLNETLARGYSPEDVAERTFDFVKSQFPNEKSKLCLFLDGDPSHCERFGESLENGDKRDKDFLFDFFDGERKIGSLTVQLESPSAYDVRRLLQLIAGNAQTALVDRIFKRKSELQLRRISFFNLVSKSVGSTLDFDSISQLILEQIQAALEADIVVLYMLDKENDEFVCKVSNGLKLNSLNNIRIKFGQPYVGIAAEEKRTTKVFDFSSIDPASPLGHVIKSEKINSQFCSPIIVGGKVTGVLEIFQRKPFIPSDEWFSYLEAMSFQTGIALEYGELYMELQKTYINLENSYEATIEGWSSALDLRDQETEGHSQRVTSLSIAMASKLGLDHEEVRRYRRGALLHDIGKIGIPDSILKKPGSLDKDEWKVMKSHPQMAANILKKIPYLADCIDIPLYHHERFDGKGYPTGLKGTEIPLSARVFSIIDVYDALTSDRPYRKAWTKTATIKYLRDMAGTQFDPAIVPVFIEMIGDDSEG
jgi:putative nucleotidyltransferase with HDIG domain/PAS domain S-box-containing protein